jgi:CheY-like chemotaxis protein
MPEMDGPTATRAIRSERSAARQPVVVALTAHALAGNREHFLAAGMDAYLAKPIRVPELLAILTQLPELRRRAA